MLLVDLLETHNLDQELVELYMQLEMSFQGIIQKVISQGWLLASYLVRTLQHLNRFCTIKIYTFERIMWSIKHIVNKLMYRIVQVYKHRIKCYNAKYNQ